MQLNNTAAQPLRGLLSRRRAQGHGTRMLGERQAACRLRALLEQVFGRMWPGVHRAHAGCAPRPTPVHHWAPRCITRHAQVACCKAGACWCARQRQPRTSPGAPAARPQPRRRRRPATPRRAQLQRLPSAAPAAPRRLHPHRRQQPPPKTRLPRTRHPSAPGAKPPRQLLLRPLNPLPRRRRQPQPPSGAPAKPRQ